MAAHYQAVLDFWFGSLTSEYAAAPEKLSMWFRDGAQYDDTIREKFSELHANACAGQLDIWQNEAKSCLALVILLDQFSRHLYRNQAQAFSNDAKAIGIVKNSIAEQVDQQLFLIERKFLYMPLMHAEDLAIQDLSTTMFSQLVDEAPIEYKESFRNTLSFAESHRYVIEKFGRFPELNSILGRTNTTAESEFLATGKYQFL